MKKFLLSWMELTLRAQKNFVSIYPLVLTILPGKNKKHLIMVFFSNFLFFSFTTDYQMVLDATVKVSMHLETDATSKSEETLYPPRHQITLPLNGLNNYFENCEVAFNHHTRLDCDRLVCTLLCSSRSINIIVLCACAHLPPSFFQKLLFGF